jgi:pimeloyl-ACP methyl ester carboxylesterase
MTAAVEAHEGTVEVTGARIWYRVVGSGKAVPLVTVHGGPGATHHSLVPGAEMVVFEHSSHVPHLEEPERFLHVLRDFLRRADRAGGPTA